MNATLMRLLDNTIGRMMCALLAAWHRLRRPHVPKYERIERLLVIKLIGLGTIMLSSALTRGLRQYRPYLQIDFLTLEGFRDAAELTGTVDRVYTLNLRAPISSVWRTIRQLRANRYQMVMDLDYFSCASMILACLSGAPRRVGFISPGYERWDLLTHIVLYSTARHILDMYGSFAEELTESRYLPPPTISVDEQVMQRGRDILSRAELDPERLLVLLNPNVSAFSVAMRRWEPEKWAGLADRLGQRESLQVAFIGSAAEGKYVNSIMAMMEAPARAVSLAGQTSLHELAAVIKLSSCMVSCDTGPLLMAVAAGTPTVALLGPTAWTHRPRGKRDRVICRDLYCSPCLTVFNQKKARCVHKTNLCMTQIQVDEVYRATLDVLAGDRHHPTGGRARRSAGGSGARDRAI